MWYRVHKKQNELGKMREKKKVKGVDQERIHKKSENQMFNRRMIIYSELLLTNKREDILRERGKEEPTLISQLRRACSLRRTGEMVKHDFFSLRHSHIFFFPSLSTRRHLICVCEQHGTFMLLLDWKWFRVTPTQHFLTFFFFPFSFQRTRFLSAKITCALVDLIN